MSTVIVMAVGALDYVSFFAPVCNRVDNNAKYSLQKEKNVPRDKRKHTEQHMLSYFGRSLTFRRLNAMASICIIRETFVIKNTWYHVIVQKLLRTMGSLKNANFWFRSRCLREACLTQLPTSFSQRVRAFRCSFFLYGEGGINHFTRSSFTKSFTKLG